MSEIKLAPPGAGLPRLELLIAKHLLMPLSRRRMSWQTADALFLEEGRKILVTFDSLAPATAAQPTLIRRIPGIEDSSRCWSAAMVVEHLNIVNAEIRHVIDQLRGGRTDLPTPSTAAVKPSGTIAVAEVREQFVESLQAAGGPPTPRRGGATCDHPWFGPLNAFGWHTLLAVHQGLHRKQTSRVAKIRMADQHRAADFMLSATADGV